MKLNTYSVSVNSVIKFQDFKTCLSKTYAVPGPGGDRRAKI